MKGNVRWLQQTWQTSLRLLLGLVCLFWAAVETWRLKMAESVGEDLPPSVDIILDYISDSRFLLILHTGPLMSRFCAVCDCDLWWSSCTEDTVWRPRLSPLRLSPSLRWRSPSAAEHTGNRCRTCAELKTRETERVSNSQPRETNSVADSLTVRVQTALKKTQICLLQVSWNIWIIGLTRSGL